MGHRDSPEMVARIDRVLDDIAAVAEGQSSGEWALGLRDRNHRYDPGADLAYGEGWALGFAAVLYGEVFLRREPDGGLQLVRSDEVEIVDP